MSDADVIIYRINEWDEICFVNAKFDEVATAVAPAQAGTASVLGRHVWDFIATPGTAHQICRDIVSRVRRGRSIQFSFRCHAPASMRLMQMHILPLQDRMVEIQVRAIEEASRPCQALPEARSINREGFLGACSFCKKVEFGGDWVELEEAVTRWHLLEHPDLPALSHGICGDCHVSMMRSLRGQSQG